MAIEGTVAPPTDYDLYSLLKSGPASSRPAPGIVDRYYFSTDTLVMERDTGIAWVEVGRGETAIRLAQLAERAHASLTGIGAADHHARYDDAEAVAAAKTVKLDDFATPDDNTDLNALTSRHGLLRKLDGVATHFLNGEGDWVAGGTVSTDWKGSFNWDTSAYTTDEQDISALFSTNLAEVIRRKYSVKLDLTNVEADGSFDELYLAVKEKIDGTNYRAIDRKTVTKADIAALAEPGIILDIPATSEHIQITMQMKTALAGDITIYYAVVKEHLE